MNLKELMVDSKSVWAEYPGMEGFEVQIANLARERLVALRKGCMISSWDKKTHQQVETLDEKKFIKKFTEATIKDWRGLKFDYLEQLMLVDVSDKDPNTELPFSLENAEVLVSNSQDFDSWVNEVVFDLDRFRTKRDRASVGKTGEMAE